MKNKIKKITKITCAILLIILVQAMGITYAKYFTQDTTTGGAEVAKWSFKIAKNGNQTQKIQLADTVNKDTLIDGKIAPGTSGSIIVTVDGTGSEVDLNYAVQFANEQNKPNNLTFTYDGVDYQSLSELPLIYGDIKYDSEVKTKDIVVSWRWGYERGSTAQEKNANNILDTQDANTITEYTFDVIASGSQSE